MQAPGRKLTAMGIHGQFSGWRNAFPTGKERSTFADLAKTESLQPRQCKKAEAIIDRFWLWPGKRRHIQLARPSVRDVEDSIEECEVWILVPLTGRTCVHAATFARCARAAACGMGHDGNGAGSLGESRVEFLLQAFLILKEAIVAALFTVPKGSEGNLGAPKIHFRNPYQ